MRNQIGSRHAIFSVLAVALMLLVAQGMSYGQVDPETAARALIDRFSADAGTLFVRDDSGALPGAGDPINLDQPPFITQGLGPDGQVVKYYNFDIQSTTPSTIYVLFREGESAPVEGQLFVVDAIPGDPGYSDFWNVTQVTVPSDYVANTVTSLAEIEAAGYAMEMTDAIVNCPVVPDGSTATLRLGGGDTELHMGWYRGEVITYFVFEERALAVDANGLVPLSEIYVTFNVNPGEDSGGPPSGFATEPGTDQAHNVLVTVPSDDNYSPLWVVNVYDNADFDAVSDLESARQATILGGAPPVNCPVVLVAEIEVPPELIAYGYAALSSEQAVPPVDAAGMGTAALRLDEAGNLHFSLTLMGLTGSITGAHFHGPAPAGETAGVVFDITDTFDGVHADGVWEGLNARQLHYLLDGLLYLNIHTELNPPGEIRGQVHMGENGSAVLSGDAQVPPIQVDGAGTGVFKLLDGGTALWYNITVADLTGAITGAHFHGPSTEAETAPVIFGITDTFDGGHAEGVWDDLSRRELQYLLDRQVYVTSISPE